MASPLTMHDGVDPRTPEEAEAMLAQLVAASHAPGLALWPLLGQERHARGPQTVAERRYRALVEQIPVVTFLAAVDQDVQELYVSPQIEKLLGFTQKEWLEDPFLWYNQLHPDDRQRWAEEFARTCATGTQFRSEYRFISRGGRVVWVHGECQVIRDEHGTPLFLQGVAYDITEQKKAEEILHRASQDLERLVQERTAELRDEVRRRQQLADQLAEEGQRKDQFLAVLAHELRNPLASILMSFDVMRQEGIGPEERGWAVDMISRQLGQMSRLIDDLLDISRITRGKIALEKSVLDLAVVLSRAAEVVRPLLQKRQHKLIVQCSPEATLVEGDPLRLEQIVTNLLSNAAKFTDPGGEIRVEVAREADDAVLRIRDNGIGIPPEMLEKIFEMFIQLDTSLARPTQWGLGIGLALVRGLVQLHGGTITAASQGKGKGSEFTIRLPLAREIGAGADGDGPERGARTPPRRKLLLVEDNTDTAHAMSLILRSWNQDVRAAHDGASALEQIEADSPDIAIIDIGLPGMDGCELARQIRLRTNSDHLKLVALSGYGRPEDRQRARDAGFDLYFTKPVEAESLRKLLNDTG